ncbi:MAG: LemA family protein [Bacilli bacterium]|nr:LemA family protein [Bacilli bacterium]
MANELDETRDPVSEEGRDVNVLQKQVAVKKSTGAVVLEVFLWILLIVPGIIFEVNKAKARSYLQALQQKIQAAASEVDNYLVKRVVTLQNTAALVNKAVDLDKDTFSAIAKYRSGNYSDAERNEVADKIAVAERSINIAMEAYPDLKAHNEIAKAMQENTYTQQEITAARSNYNDAVLQWNTTIFQWPIYQMVAAKAGYTSRIPFAASLEMKKAAQGVFF